MIAPLIPVWQRRLAQARRRLAAQTLINHVGFSLGIALAVSAVWLLVEPFALPTAHVNTKWYVVGGIGGAALAVALGAAYRRRPTPQSAAIAVDHRFGLNERVTTALSLSESMQSSEAARAVLDDADAKTNELVVRTQFPVGPGRRAWWIIGQAAVIVAIAMFYDPSLITNTVLGTDKNAAAAKAKEEEAGKSAANNPPRQFIKPPAERSTTSAELRAIEAELRQMYEEFNKENPQEKEKPEIARERAEKIGETEDKLKKYEQKQMEKFQRLQEQMNRMMSLEPGEKREDGPAKEFEEQLAKGDLKKAQEEVDRLKKKVRDKKLDEKEKQQLEKEMKSLEDKLDRLNRENEQKKQQLKDMIKKAKQENRDADSLERELKNLEQQLKATPEMEQLSKQISKCKQCLEKNDFEGAAEQLEAMGKQLGDLDAELQDLEDLEEHLQNLKQMKKKACEGACRGDGTKPGEGEGEGQGRQEGAEGKRPENKDAATKAGEEKRVRGYFDPSGRKLYGGATNGPAFKKASSVEMAGEIQQAVQEAPDAVEVQRLPKAARDMVKQYFEKLGGQAPKK